MSKDNAFKKSLYQPEHTRGQQGEEDSTRGQTSSFRALDNVETNEAGHTIGKQRRPRFKGSLKKQFHLHSELPTPQEESENSSLSS